MVRRILQGVGILFLLAIFAFAVALVRFDKTKEELVPKYTNAASQFLTLASGATAHVRDEGSRDAPVLVLVHGSTASLQTWEPWVARLSPSYRVVTMDMPGHGLTGAVPGDDYSRDGMVTFTHEVVQKLGLTHYAIGGNSMGGGVAAEYAEEFPGEVTALILVDAAGLPRVAQAGDKIPIGFRIARIPVLRDIFRFVTPRSLYSEGLRKVFVDQSLVTDAMVTRYYDLNLYDGNRRATMIRFTTPPNDNVVSERLGEIRAPTLILWGDKDTLIPLANAYEFQKRISGAKVIVYPNVGHIPMEEVADRSAIDVAAFLAASLSGGAANGEPVETMPVHHDGKVQVVPISPE